MGIENGVGPHYDCLVDDIREVFKEIDTKESVGACKRVVHEALSASLCNPKKSGIGYTTTRISLENKDYLDGHQSFQILCIWYIWIENNCRV